MNQSINFSIGEKSWITWTSTKSINQTINPLLINQSINFRILISESWSTIRKQWIHQFNNLSINQSINFRIWDATVASHPEVPVHLLPTFRPLRRRLMGRLPHPTRGQPTNQTINQSINELMNWKIYQCINWFIDEKIVIFEQIDLSIN